MAARRRRGARGGSKRDGGGAARDEAAAAPDFEGGEPGRVVAHHGPAVLVRYEDGREEQVWLQPDQRAVVGDRVRVRDGRLAVEPASGVLRRFDARGRERTIAANLDRLGLVVAPEPREPPGYLDRGFVIARAAGIEPFVVLNKIDLDPDGELGDRLEAIYAPSAPVLRTSAASGAGLDAIRALLAGGQTGAFVGPSGVGKSSLLNALVPDLELVVGDLNRGSGRGRHTTTTATLHALDGGGFLVDTAGFKDFIAVDVSPLEAAHHFPGFETAVGRGCRFRDCLHRSEPDCAVRAAVEAEEIAPRRHRSYLALVEELEAGEPRR